ncbi:MAG: alanine racemase [Bacilli bacterium]|nr:alanine racemase [Bacilli bacterium]
MKDLLYQQINLTKIGENWDAITAITQKDIIAVVKSRCYGLGDQQIPKFLEKKGCKILAVVDEQEAMRLLEFGIKTNVLILNSVSCDFYEQANHFSNLVFSVNSLNDARILSKYDFSRLVKLHIQIDTGMNRLGFTSIEEFTQALHLLKQNSQLYLEGLYTHFSSSNSRTKQEKFFLPYMNIHPFPIVHCAASSTYEYSQIGNFVRVGLDLYGDGSKPFLSQSVSVGCYPLAVNFIKKGETIGYQEAYTAKEDMFVAVLPIGYYNGFRRSLSGIEVIANNRRYQTVGIVCMNHLFVSVDESIDVNTHFTILSPDLSVYELAKHLNTTPHEILCMLNIDNKIYVE